jgi:hypothetical protein
MIAVNQIPQIEAVHQWPDTNRHGSKGWWLIFWVGDAFDYSIPFRAILQEMVARLSVSVDCTLHIPAHYEYEDFVEGKLDWGAHSFDLYYEHSLGFLELKSSDKRALERLLDALSNIIVVSRT